MYFSDSDLVCALYCSTDRRINQNEFSTKADRERTQIKIYIVHQNTNTAEHIVAKISSHDHFLMKMTQWPLLKNHSRTDRLVKTV